MSFRQKTIFLSKYKAGVLLGTIWTATIAVAVLLLYLGTDAVNHAQVRLKDQAEAYAHLIAAHDRFGFTLADVILKDLQDYVTTDDLNGPLTPQRKQQLFTYLSQHRTRLPGIASFTLIGADGIRRVGVVGQDGTNLSDRGYFIELRNGKDFYISGVQDGRASGKPGIHVARRFNRPDGSFAGVVVMNLAAQDVFFSFYKSINFGPNTTTSLRDAERILLRFPADIRNPEIATRRLRGDAIGQVIQAGQDQGFVIGIDPMDGLEKLTAFERLEGSLMYATVSLPTEAAMSGPKIVAFASYIAALALLFGAYGVTSAIQKAGKLARARDEAVKAAQERQRLIRRLNTVVEDERKAISIEIHDVLNAILIGIRLDSQAILSSMTQAQHTPLMDEVVERAKSIAAHANDLYAACRAIVTRLRPEVLDVLGLDEAIEEMVKTYNATHPACTFTFHFDGSTAGVDPNIGIAAYRIVQEALSNVVKHANAHHADVSLKVLDDELRLAIEDDGRGFSEQQDAAAGFGLVGMRERADAFGGSLEIHSARNDGGSRIVARIPLKPQQTGVTN
ncbi:MULTISPECIES: cache domain-containing sensor histidine kinase [Burkholderiaceae]|jgi:signal transduction histidine kinase|uniref:Histidine kinase domain-containing protein n=1 Tax=Ralstonia pickettii TaxID=329 RepID=A0AAW4QCS6_RALPI|nr:MULTISPECIES: ATP-binding protein [Burkholderiaceae]UNK04303.1 ATP-binding protein [Ralstonia insidiosa]MBX3756432.1 hypothetical protein [Ralstonia pickettii]MBX3785604.1 hypothetical protein [Ralstonia pickettii]MBX3790514.1 hypothetical protein [Ralstonia pickettii]MBX3795235.1 hypothetical protein [Ralstonia pickettii]